MRSESVPSPRFTQSPPSRLAERRASVRPHNSQYSHSPNSTVWLTALRFWSSLLFCLPYCLSILPLSARGHHVSLRKSLVVALTLPSVHCPHSALAYSVLRLRSLTGWLHCVPPTRLHCGGFTADASLSFGLADDFELVEVNLAVAIVIHRRHEFLHLLHGQIGT